MRWMITEDKLGADQIEVIEDIGKNINKPIWIMGHAGSGKSVLLLHALADYVTKHPNAKVCVVVFTRSLVDLLKTGIEQIPKLTGKSIPVLTIYQLRNKLSLNTKSYHAIFCDEVQDLSIDFLNLMKGCCNQLVLAGDAEQSIYMQVPKWNQKTASPEEIKTNLEPIEKKLRVIYRLTDSVLKVLQNVFPTMLRGLINIAKEDTEISLYQAKSLEEEVKFCWENIKQTNRLRTTEVSAVLLYSQNVVIDFVNAILSAENKEPWNVSYNYYRKPNYGEMNNYLKQNKIPIMYIGSGYGSLKEADDSNLVVITTYHSAKGLDFDYVYLPMVNEEMSLGAKYNSLLLVALSRSKSGLFISYSGTLYPPLQVFLKDISPKKIEDDNSSEINDNTEIII